MEHVRLLLVVALSFISLMLWDAWQEGSGRPQVVDETETKVPPLTDTPVPNVSPPAAKAGPILTEDPRIPPDMLGSAEQGTGTITVETDVLALEISTLGGTVERAALLKYPTDSNNRNRPVELLHRSFDHTFVYQGGLAGSAEAPTHHSQYLADEKHYRMGPDQDALVVTLRWRDEGAGHEVNKQYKFLRGSYLVDVKYELRNRNEDHWRIHYYEQLQRSAESGRKGMVYTFTGAAFSTPEKRFEKYDYDDFEDSPLNETASEAWIGVMQHYFIAALIPPSSQANQYYSKILDNNKYLVGYVSPVFEVGPGQTISIESRTYIGPKRHDLLAPITPGLELAVDYGVLWFIAKPLFITLEYLFRITGNWGWAIVILTFMLKVVFYPLSAAGYRSMANMRKVQPRLLALRDRFKGDKAQLNQAMMKLYKEEKINPLGGCFPILIQIPVFIALYWVLLESVEIRQAPFVLWIDNLTDKDPFFVLPVLMGLSMWGQQKLNPAPLDPVQAKVMQLLPWVFTIFFAFFPSGLVLYWLVNNILSIAQQWRITRIIERESSG